MAPAVRSVLPIGLVICTCSPRSSAPCACAISVRSRILWILWSCGSQLWMATPAGASGLKNSSEKSSPFAFQCSITWRLSSICICPTISAKVRKPINAISSRTSSATKKKKLITCSGLPMKRLRSTGSCVATPTGQVLRWHLRIMMQPAAISGAVEKPNPSAPKSAPTTTSRPVRIPPSTCTAIRPRRRFETRDGDVIGARFRNAGRDGADADFGDELHRHVAFRVDVLEIEDELRQILDRIDVMVRGRRNQPDAGHRVAHFGDDLIDLVAGQLPAFAGLGALRHLDLHHVRVDQI